MHDPTKDRREAAPPLSGGREPMPIEIRRFGAGHRRPEGPPGTVGVSGQVIHSDSRGVVAELAFGTGARIEPHSNPNTTWFVVIEGGGWVQVADEPASARNFPCAFFTPSETATTQ